MKNVSHRKECTASVLEQHLEPPLTPLIKSKHSDNSDKNFVKLKLYRDPTFYKSDLYEFKMALLKNGDP